MKKLFCHAQLLCVLLWVCLYVSPNLAAGSSDPPPPPPPAPPAPKGRNDRPIIGVMAQERAGEDEISFIAVPYVKQMESAGARVVPVLIEQSDEYYRNIIRDTNGLVLPGGNRNITGSNFQHAAQLLFKFATEANDRGEHYPIYGVCQGLQIMTLMILEHWEKNPEPYILTKCSAEDLSVNLKFATQPKDSRIFHDADDTILNTLTKDSVTPNYHRKCVTPTNVTKSGLYKHLRIVTTSVDKKGLEFVSTFESVNASRPVYLLQWHPEKILFEFKIVPQAQENLFHTPNAIVMSQYMSDFFVDEARRNLNQYPTTKDEDEALIYNCDPIYTMSTSEGDHLEREHFSQLYWFPSKKGCGAGPPPPPLFDYNLIVIVALAVVIVALVAAFVATWACKKRNSYQQIGV